MTIFRSVFLGAIAAPLALVAALPAAASLPTSAGDPVPAPAATPTAKLTGSISPNSSHLSPGTPISFTLDTRLSSDPPGGDFVLQRLDYLFPHGTVVNGRLFPSCDAATLARANGRLSFCPKGSKIGGGTAAGTAVAIGVTSHAVVTLFNGPGGRSITMNVSITTPALINASFSAPFRTLTGRYANELTVVLPDSLKRVLDGDIVTSRIHVTTGATRIVHGVKRGYVEADHCPSSGKARIHGEFTFDGDAKASADTTVKC